MSEKIDYKSAGVDVERGYEAVSKIKGHVARTATSGVLSGIGGFGGAFAIPKGYDEPVLVSGTDGVGTKLRIAFESGRHDTIGIDCVAMCVNDIICQGAKPLFFLDYIGTGHILPDQVAEIVKGISEGCVQAGCALVGGETAEMPDFYGNGEYDLAGFSTGIVEREKMITGERISAGDILIGLCSSGLHSNGFSLVRKLLFEIGGYSLSDIPEGLSRPLIDELLTPTKIYVKEILSLLDNVDIKGISHITGGGWTENIPRMLPKGMRAVVSKHEKPPEIFHVLKTLGALDDTAMYGTFNMGIGMVIAVSKKDVETVLSLLPSGESMVLGTVEEGDGIVIL